MRGSSFIEIFEPVGHIFTVPTAHNNLVLLYQVCLFTIRHSRAQTLPLYSICWLVLCVLAESAGILLLVFARGRGEKLPVRWTS